MGKKALVVDDDEKLRKLVQEYLEGYGFQIIALPDGLSVLKTIRRESPDIVILDIMLPGRDGLDVLKDIRAEHTLPVIMLTAKGEDADRIVGLELGADDYLPKPFNPRELLARMKSKLRSQIKKPLRDGLTAKLGGVELVDTFYNVFAENMHELGSPVHSRKWISAVVLEYGDRARVGVVFTPEGMPAAAGIILLHERIVSIPWASSLRKFNRLNPNMLLYWTFLSFAADNGFEKFDYGRSSPGEGTFKFKEQWGAMPQPLSWDYFSFNGEPVERFQTSSKMRGYLEKIWQRSPLPMCNFCGPLLRKYVSL